MARIPRPSGTPESERKKSSDVVLDLFRRGRLERRHVLAAEYIRDIACALSGAMLASPRYEPRECDISRKYGGRALLERLPDKIYLHWKNIYGPWEQSLLIPVLASRSLTLLRLALLVIVENATPVQLRAAFGISASASVSGHIYTALELYSKMAKLK